MNELDDIRVRVEALEADNAVLHQAFRQADAEAAEALAGARANAMLIGALRTTQMEHGRLLGGLVTDVVALKTDVRVLKTDVADLKTDVADLKTGMSTVTALVRQVLDRLPAPPAQ